MRANFTITRRDLAIAGGSLLLGAVLGSALTPRPSAPAATAPVTPTAVTASTTAETAPAAASTPADTATPATVNTTAAATTNTPAASPTDTPPAAQKPDAVLDLFQPSEKAVKQQVNEAEITKQIEDALVTSFALVRCRIITQKDYEANYLALQTYAKQSHLASDAAQTETKLRAIADSASASYTMVYSNADCNDPTLVQKATTLAQWRKTIMSTPAPAK